MYLVQPLLQRAAAVIRRPPETMPSLPPIIAAITFPIYHLHTWRAQSTQRCRRRCLRANRFQLHRKNFCTEDYGLTKQWCGALQFSKTFLYADFSKYKIGEWKGVKHEHCAMHPQGHPFGDGGCSSAHL